MSDTPTTPQAGIADAFGQLSEQTAALVRQEIETARAEIADKVRNAAAGGALLGAAGATGTFAAASLHTLFLRTLDKRLPPAWAAFTATVTYAGIAGALGREGVRRLRAAQPPYPTATLRQAARDVGRATGP
jgi:hypothetical protein